MRRKKEIGTEMREEIVESEVVGRRQAGRIGLGRAQNVKSGRVPEIGVICTARNVVRRVGGIRLCVVAEMLTLQKCKEAAREKEREKRKG